MACILHAIFSSKYLFLKLTTHSFCFITILDILIVGNVKDISQVNSDELLVKDLPVEVEEVKPVFIQLKKVIHCGR